jgi:hypothetical protein
VLAIEVNYVDKREEAQVMFNGRSKMEWEGCFFTLGFEKVW